MTWVIMPPNFYNSTDPARSSVTKERWHLDVSRICNKMVHVKHWFVLFVGEKKELISFECWACFSGLLVFFFLLLLFVIFFNLQRTFFIFTVFWGVFILGVSGLGPGNSRITQLMCSVVNMWIQTCKISSSCYFYHVGMARFDFHLSGTFNQQQKWI